MEKEASARVWGPQGTVLPFLLAWVRVDPAHAGSSIQVVMDVLGVSITMLVCTAILGTGKPSAEEMRLTTSAVHKHGT